MAIGHEAYSGHQVSPVPMQGSQQGYAPAALACGIKDGDILERVNHEDITSRDSAAVLQDLKQVPKDAFVSMVFRRPGIRSGDDKPKDMSQMDFALNNQGGGGAVWRPSG